MIEKKLKKYVSRLKKVYQVAFGKTFVYSLNTYKYHNLSFSQEGEDRILARLFGQKSDGFYVDVGAHHPQLFSNTYLFYLKGWRGINIDAMPGCMNIFEETRPDEIHLELAVSEKEEDLNYYMFTHPAYNGFSQELSKERDGLRDKVKLVAQKTIKTCRLSDILDRYLPSSTTIEFMTIDVEGLDYQVVLSNDWTKYRPKIVLVEELGFDLSKTFEESKTYLFLKKQGYKIFAKTMNTVFYVSEESSF